mmetsp:Transcript_63421/g.151578  ORF Transcript_63421/g.151578 Transcript_63421/m.151578 type:complete len:288 (+) Transcript_63421:1901-2764(+)
MGLDERVVADDIGHAVLLHLLHPSLGLLQLAAFHACIQHGVVDHRVQLGAALLQGLEDVHGSIQVLLNGTAADHGDVLCHVGRVVRQQRLRKLAAATLQGSVHDATLHARIQDASAFACSFLSQWRRILLIHVAHLLIVLYLEVEADEGREDRQRHLLGEVLVGAVCEGEVVRLLAAHQERQAQLGPCICLLGQSLLKQLRDLVVPSFVSLHQHAVRGLREDNVFAAGQLLNLLKQLQVPLPHRLADHKVHRILCKWDRRKLGKESLELVLLAGHVHELTHDVARCR